MNNVSMSWSSYPSSYNLGHRAVKDLLTVPVVVEEKIDGSQFSMCRVSDEELLVRSKGAVMYVEAPEKMFTKAVQTAKNLDLHLGWTYRCEYLAKPKHNALAYDRVPEKHLILFDVNTGDQEYLGYKEKVIEAERLGLEVVPALYEGLVNDAETLRNILDNTMSVLGGQKIEGVVIKPVGYNMYGVDKKVLLGKFVSESFKEVHRKEWKVGNPTGNDIIARLKQEYSTPARWNKAIAHMRDAGTLAESPTDIGPLIKEVQADVRKECEDEIKEKIWQWAWPQVQRVITAGLPEWYKGELLKKQFEQEIA